MDSVERKLSCVSVFFLLLGAILSTGAAEFYVAPDGTDSGGGSLGAPWDLQTALNHPEMVQPGDTIWLRNGVYRRENRLTRFTSQLQGTPEQPITVRRLPGERVVIDGALIQMIGGSVHYWGFEVMNSHTNRTTIESGSFPQAFYLPGNDGAIMDWATSGVDLRAPDIKVINLIIHDSIGGGISVSSSAFNPEIYGVLSFYNGWQGCDRGHGHGLYIQSRAPSQALISDSLFFANYALGIQATSNHETLDNLTFSGNGIFLNGVLARRHQGNLLIGSVMGQARRPRILGNFIFDFEGSSSDCNIGYGGGTVDAVVENNYFQTDVHFSEQNQNMILQSNVFLGETFFLIRSNYPNNLFERDLPGLNRIEIKTNRFEQCKVMVVVYNWEDASNITIDLTGILPQGLPFEVRTAQNYLGAPVLSGVFDGKSMVLPLKDLPILKPVGGPIGDSETGKFQVFLIQPLELSPDPTFTNNAPVISSIPDIIIEAASSDPVAFTIWDMETPANYLAFSVSCSNTDLIPYSGIRIEGSATERTITVQPTSGETGIGHITLSVSDGLKYAETTFRVEVRPEASLSADFTEPPATLTIELYENGIRMLIEGVSNSDYDISTSTNLIQWQYSASASTDCLGKGSFQVVVSDEPVTRFYRVNRAISKERH